MSTERDKRRGIDRTAHKLREQVRKGGGRDPGFQACRDRVEQARRNVERKNGKG